MIFVLDWHVCWIVFGKCEVCSVCNNLNIPGGACWGTVTMPSGITACVRASPASIHGPDKTWIIRPVCTSHTVRSDRHQYMSEHDTFVLFGAPFPHYSQTLSLSPQSRKTAHHSTQHATAAAPNLAETRLQQT